MERGFWVAERRLLADQNEAHAWLALACAKDRDEAETKYRLSLLHLRGHEMRLVDPNGVVVLYHRFKPEETATRWAA